MIRKIHEMELEAKGYVIGYIMGLIQTNTDYNSIVNTIMQKFHKSQDEADALIREGREQYELDMKRGLLNADQKQMNIISAIDVMRSPAFDMDDISIVHIIMDRYHLTRSEAAHYLRISNIR